MLRLPCIAMVKQDVSSTMLKKYLHIDVYFDFCCRLKRFSLVNRENIKSQTRKSNKPSTKRKDKPITNKQVDMLRFPPRCKGSTLSISSISRLKTNPLCTQRSPVSFLPFTDPLPPFCCVTSFHA